MTAGPGIRKRPAAEREALATRVRELDADVLCLQQVEDDAAPAAFNEGLAAEGVLEDSYPYRVHAPSHDLRVAGIGTLSRLPLGQVSTWSHVLDGDSAAFARRPLEVEILAPGRQSRVAAPAVPGRR
jgi:endonuclease/exonuclease/phosphatase family metal-dependent hydrolase